MSKIIKTPGAKQDTADIATYLYSVNPASDASERFLTATENAFARLVDMPGVGVAYCSAPARHADLSRWPVPSFRNYLIFYRLLGDDVEIVRVLHAARDIASALDEDDDTGLTP